MAILVHLSPDEESHSKIVSRYRAFISERPVLLSVLYDVDMLPEQVASMAGASRLAAICEAWRKGEKSTLPGATMSSETAAAIEEILQADPDSELLSAYRKIASDAEEA